MIMFPLHFKMEVLVNSLFICTFNCPDSKQFELKRGFWFSAIPITVTEAPHKAYYEFPDDY